MAFKPFGVNTQVGVMGDAFPQCNRTLTSCSVVWICYHLRLTLIVLLLCSIRCQCRTVVLPLHQLGLANRMRGLVSAMVLCEVSPRCDKLVVDWRPNSECNVAMDDIFDVVVGGGIGMGMHSNSYEFSVESGMVDSSLTSSKSPPLSMTTTLNSTHSVYHQVGFILDEFLRAAEDVIILVTRGQFMLTGMDCTDWYERKSRAYQSLMSTSRLSEVADGLLKELGAKSNSILVGVHIRKHDVRHDWEVVPPQSGLLNETGKRSPSGPALAGTFDNIAPFALFRDAIDSVLRRHPGAKFYIASNNDEVKRNMTSEFPGIAYAATFETTERTILRGVEAALVDFTVLAGSNLVIHTFGSSFGEEASSVYSIPSVRIRSGGNIYGVDSSLPFCNNPQLLAFGSAEEKVCFVDGRNRNVCQPKLLKKRCIKATDEWGVDCYC